MNEIFVEVGDLLIGKNEIVMAIHKKERGLVEIGVGKPDLAFFLNHQGGGAGNQLHQVLTNPAAIVSVVQAIPNTSHEEGRLLIGCLLCQTGASGDADAKPHPPEAREPHPSRRPKVFFARDWHYIRAQRFRRSHSMVKQPKMAVKVQAFNPTGWRVLWVRPTCCSTFF